MKPLQLIVVLLFFAFNASSQDKSPYHIYNSKGKKISYKKMIKSLEKNDVILFGELHNNAISHWLQLEVTKDCDKTRDVILGAEMFERDNQEAVQRYLSGSIGAKGLDSQARLWKNYPTDYAPLLNYAKDSKLNFIATNVPRRYASQVMRHGLESLDSLPAQEKEWIAPLPIAYDGNLPGYKNMLAMMPGHGGENLPKAQAIKDATMAYYILKDYQPGQLLIHFNGSYHSENYEGIFWYLKRAQPQLKISTISTVVQSDITKLASENKNKADFIICVDADMTNTY